MRKSSMILIAAVAMAMAAPAVQAQGRPGGAGGGPPAGVGGGASGSHMGSSMGNMGGTRGNSSMGDMHSMDGRSKAEMHRENARTPEQALFGLSTAERAKLLKDADLDARKAFGAYQSALAKAKHEQGAGEASLDAMRASRSEMASFGADTQARAVELKDADRSTRKAFGKLQAALARAQGLERAAGQASVQAAFGQETASAAKLQGQADADARATFGPAQAAKAKQQSTVKSDQLRR